MDMGFVTQNKVVKMGTYFTPQYTPPMTFGNVGWNHSILTVSLPGLPDLKVWNYHYKLGNAGDYLVAKIINSQVTPGRHGFL